MCGICGYLTTTKPLPPLAQMVDTLRRRGPDGDGSFQTATPEIYLGLGYTRLAIVGLDSGNQPLFSADQQKVMVCNGEIYNYPELRQQMLKKGYTLSTHSDCEIILSLYEMYGVALFEHLNGMFSFALWDASTETLLLARDRFGKKPLYYSYQNQQLLFGSEIKAILAGGAKAVLEESVLDAYLTTGVVPGGYSIFQNIFQIPPGHYALWKQGKWTITPYFSLTEFSPLPPNLTLKKALEEAVALRLQSDVPYGAFLSGGLDSSLVLALIRQHNQEPLPTFSIGFEHPLYDELPFARQVSAHFKTQHHEEILAPESIQILEKLIEVFDEPFGDSSAIACYYLSQLAQKKVKMVLTGDGGDELFWGYPRYQALQLAQIISPFTYVFQPWIERIPVNSEPKSKTYRLKKLCSQGRKSLSERYLLWSSAFSLEQKESLYTPEFARRIKPLEDRRKLLANCHSVQDFVLYDQKTYLPEDILVKVDRTSMANGLECRSPFLDWRVVLLANQLPQTQKLHWLEGKYILKKWFGKLLPPEILKRKKMGFGVPIAAWMKERKNHFCHERLLSTRLQERGWFQPKTVERWWQEHLQGKVNHAERLWLLLNLEIWCEKYLKN